MLGIDLPRDIGTRRLRWQRLTRIIEHLPEDSATARARRNHGPSIDRLFLRRTEYWLHLLWWAKTEDAKKKKNQPVPVPLTSDDKKKGGRDTFALDQLLAQRQQKRQAELQGTQP